MRMRRRYVLFAVDEQIIVDVEALDKRDNIAYCRAI